MIWLTKERIKICIHHRQYNSTHQSKKMYWEFVSRPFRSDLKEKRETFPNGDATWEALGKFWNWLTYLCFSPNSESTLRGSYGRCKKTGVPSRCSIWSAAFDCTGSHKSSLVRCPCAFRLRRFAPNVWTVFLVSEGVVLLARRAGFLSYVRFVGQVWGIRGISIERRLARQVHRTLFHPCGKRANFCTSLKRWQVWVGQNDRWFWRSLCVARAVFGKLWTTFSKGRNSQCVKRSAFLIWDMMMSPPGRFSTSDASCSSFVASAVLCRPGKKWLRHR